VDGPPEPEPTALAALALESTTAERWLHQHQAEDGGFAAGGPSVSNTAATPLAAIAMTDTEARARALDFMRQNRAAEPPEGVPSSTDVRGWGWTPTTYGWVEPTSRVLLAMRLVDPTASDDIKEAVALLAERETEQGGWNYGNASARGTDLKPYVQTTAAGVVALQGLEEPMLDRAVRLLHDRAPHEAGGLSLAMSILALRLADDDAALVDSLVTSLVEQYEATAFLGDLVTLGWATLATGDGIDRVRVPS
jgi:hypothetical protein